MSFLEKRKQQLGIKSMGDLKRSGAITGKIDPTRFVRGPEGMDCLERPWHRGDLTGILAGAGTGKCLAKGTKVLMFDGSRKSVEDIQVGELLMGPDSKPRKVLSLARGREEMFRVSGTDKTSYVVNRSHILSLRKSYDDNRYGMQRGDILNISIDDYLKKSDKFKSVFKGYRVGVEFEEQSTNFEPYMMGLWLGDGTKGKPEITNQDPEIVAYIRNYMEGVLGYKVTDYNRNSDRNVKQLNFTNSPKDGNPFNKERKNFLTSDNQKKIPSRYLINSEKNRLQLLAGIIDTDGYLSNNGYEVIIKDDVFADDFEFLCRSLGFKVGRTIKKGTIKSSNFVGYYHRFNINGHTGKIPCKVERKKASPRRQIKEPLNYGITLESLGEGEYYGFTIDGDHLFLLGDFVVTHNTSYLLYAFKHILMNNPEGAVAFVSLEMTASEVAEKWFKATEEYPELADRFYIIENYDENGTSKEMTVCDIRTELNNLKSALGTTIHAFAVDHLHEINIESSLDYNPICKKLKNIAVELDSHGFVLSQTTKGKGVGDIPVPKDGCFGTSRYEWLMTNIITIFQPLLRVQKECKLPVLGWQYAKIRYKNSNDKIKENMNYLLKFDFDTEDLVELDRNEKATFKMYYEKVLELRQNEEKFKSFQFDLSQTIKTKDGKEVKLTDIFGGHNNNED